MGRLSVFATGMMADREAATAGSGSVPRLPANPIKYGDLLGFGV